MANQYCGQYEIINIVRMLVSGEIQKEFAIGGNATMGFVVTHSNGGEYYWSQYDIPSFSDCLEFLQTKGEILSISKNIYTTLD